MCPYCGEEVPDDSAKCWKCGTEISEGAAKAASDGDELEVPDDDEEGSPQATPDVECPHCGAPVPRKAQRCRECGRMVREVKGSHGAAAWKWGTWILVLAVGAGIAAAVIAYSVERRGNAERAKAIAVTFENLKDKVKPLQRTNEERRREVWTREFHNKFVKWTGVFVQKDASNDLVVMISQTKSMPGQTDVIVEFEESEREALSDLKVGGPIVYSARLVEFGADGAAFKLTQGRLEDK